MKTFIVAILFSLSAYAAPKYVPVVTAQQLKVGNTWFWSYYQKGDLQKWYSTERYRVVEHNGTKLAIEIWSLYSWSKEYTPSAKFTLDLNNCFQAFTGPQKKTFALKMYAFVNGAWADKGYDVDSTAFEEKFNCNPNVYSGDQDDYQTNFKDLNTTAGIFNGFQQFPQDKNSQVRSFYFFDHIKLQGIAFQKTFNPEREEFFEMYLTDWLMQ